MEAPINVHSVGKLHEIRPMGPSARCRTSLISGQRKHRASGQQVDLGADCEVIADQSRDHGVWLIRTGILRLQRFAFDGRRQIVSLFLPGEIVGYEHQRREGMSVVSATPCNLCRFDRRDFDTQLDEDPALRKDFDLQQTEQLGRLRWLTWSIGALRPEERLCAFLALSTRYMPYQPLPDGTGILSMLLSRADIADLLATTVESISRITRGLDESGVIEIRDPSHFRIIDRRTLTALGRVDSGFDTMPFRTWHRPEGRTIWSPACANCVFDSSC